MLTPIEANLNSVEPLTVLHHHQKPKHNPEKLSITGPALSSHVPNQKFKNKNFSFFPVPAAGGSLMAENQDCRHRSDLKKKEAGGKRVFWMNNGRFRLWLPSRKTQLSRHNTLQYILVIYIGKK